MKKPNNLSDAIRELDNVAPIQGKNFKEILEKDYEAVKAAIENIRPYLDDLKDNVGHEAKEMKKKTEEKVRENPWAALGIVGLVAFIIGLLIGNNRR